MFCAKCGNQLNDGVKFCSKCGASVEGGQTQPMQPINSLTQNQPIISQVENGEAEKKKLNTMALIGFITGLISWFLNFWGIVGIIACIFSGIGLGKFNPNTENNKWMAVIGIISGVANIIYALFAIFQ